MCDRKFQVSYLVKYITGKEEHQLVNVAGTKNINELKVTTEEHAHEKITSCKRLQALKEKTNRQLGREISLAEVVWFVLEFPYTYCTSDFVHVPTLPLECRVGVLRWNKGGVTSTDPTHIPAVDGRVAFTLPDWRLFSDSQRAHVEDYVRSPYCCDPTSGYNIRPPELFFFKDLQLYCECFVAIGKQNVFFEHDMALQPWFDGLSRRIKIRYESSFNTSFSVA